MILNSFSIPRISNFFSNWMRLKSGEQLETFEFILRGGGGGTSSVFIFEARISVLRTSQELVDVYISREQIKSVASI